MGWVGDELARTVVMARVDFCDSHHTALRHIGQLAGLRADVGAHHGIGVAVVGDDVSRLHFPV